MALVPCVEDPACSGASLRLRQVRDAPRHRALPQSQPFRRLGIHEYDGGPAAGAVEGVRHVGRDDAAEVGKPRCVVVGPEMQWLVVAEAELDGMVSVHGARIVGGADPEHPARPGADLPPASTPRGASHRPIGCCHG